MKKIIKLTESDLLKIVKKVLNEQLLPTLIGKGSKGEEVKQIQQRLFDLKLLKTDTMVPTGFFGRLTQQALITFQKNNRLKPTGTLDELTKKMLFNSKFPFGGGYDATKGNGQGKIKQPKVTGKDNQGINKEKTNTNPVIKKSNRDRCIAVSKEECDKISSNSQTVISSGAETRCSAYMVKCLSQYDKDLYGGNAWDVFNNVKNNGEVKYNAYTDGSIDWTSIYSKLKQNKIGKDICGKYASSMDTDKSVNSSLPKIISNSVPQSSKVNINSLKLGDIVGLYHSGSANKGMAFCQRALKRNLDDNGNMGQDPFTFNSHVGFVGAIKNGVPIVIHNVHGAHTATPATKMMSKSSEDMIVWVVSDNDIVNAIK
jgi:peptidoglycan hydrolase-like protein with peptidoglycan-binding domain